MPELLHQVPVANDAPLDRVHHFMSTIKIPGLFPDAKVQSVADFAVAPTPSHVLTLIARLCDEGGDVEGGLSIASIAHFGIPSPIVDDHNFAIKIHPLLLLISLSIYCTCNINTQKIFYLY